MLSFEMYSMIKKIDPAAANWIISQDFNNNIPIDSTELAAMFDWDDTPQGFNYWLNINVKLTSKSFKDIPKREYLDKGVI